jgi:hypothetical protein
VAVLPSGKRFPYGVLLIRLPHGAYLTPRHTFASFLIAAGVNAKAFSAAMGHSSISITPDRYGHLMPGSTGEVRDRLDAYVAWPIPMGASGNSRSRGRKVARKWPGGSDSYRFERTPPDTDCQPLDS